MVNVYWRRIIPLVQTGMLDGLFLVMQSGEGIGIDPNYPGFLTALAGRGIISPEDRDQWPAWQYLDEHRKEWRL